MTEIQNQLKLLVTFHYVVSALAGVFALFPLIHLGLGLMMVLSPETLQGGGQPPPAFIGWLFVIVGACCIVVGLVFAACVFFAGRSIQQRKRHMFCLVMAGVQCMFMPFGTVLGIFTLILLTKEEVKREWQADGGLQTPPLLP